MTMTYEPTPVGTVPKRRVYRALAAVAVAVWLPNGGWAWLTAGGPNTERWWTAERYSMSDQWRAEQAAKKAAAKASEPTLAKR